MMTFFNGKLNNTNVKTIIDILLILTGSEVDLISQKKIYVDKFHIYFKDIRCKWNIFLQWKINALNYSTF